jgi:tetratricopeptide (TPR) repeat protein
VTAYDDFMRGMACLKEGRLDEAIRHLERARDREPRKASIREALGRARFAAGDFPLAAREFEAALACDPTNDYAHFGLGLSLIRSGKRTLGVGHLKLARALNPSNEDYVAYMRRYEDD